MIIIFAYTGPERIIKIIPKTYETIFSLSQPIHISGGKRKYAKVKISEL